MWLRDCQKQLERNDAAKAIGKRIQISYKQPRNLQKIAGGCKNVVEGGSRPPPDAGCFKCGQCRVLCPKLNETTHFTSTATQKRYPIRQNVTCKSDWVVYLGTCLKCKGQYVGKSKTVMKVRHSNHKQEIKNVVGGLGHHYGGAGVCGYNNLTLTIIEHGILSRKGVVLAAPTEGVSRKWLQEPLQEKRIWKKVNSGQPKLVLKKYEKLCLFLFGSQSYVKFI